MKVEKDLWDRCHSKQRHATSGNVKETIDEFRTFI